MNKKLEKTEKTELKSEIKKTSTKEKNKKEYYFWNSLCLLNI